MGESLRLVLPWVDWLREPGMRNLEAVAELAQLIFFGGKPWKTCGNFSFFYVSHVFFQFMNVSSSFFLYKMVPLGGVPHFGTMDCVIECGI